MATVVCCVCKKVIPKDEAIYFEVEGSPFCVPCANEDVGEDPPGVPTWEELQEMKAIALGYSWEEDEVSTDTDVFDYMEEEEAHKAEWGKHVPTWNKMWGPLEGDEDEDYDYIPF